VENNASQNKTRSIRATDETFAKFKEITESIGSGTNESLSALINAYELQQAKQVLSGQAALIDDFKARADGIIKAYISALELSVNAEERIRAEFTVQIESQAKTIAALQRENESIKAETIKLQTEAQSEIRALKADLAAVQTALQTAKANEQRAAESKAQSERITALTNEKLQELQSTVKDLQERAAATDRLKAENEEYEKEFDKLNREKKEIKAYYESQIQAITAEQETAIQRAINQTTAAYQQKIAELQQQQAAQLAHIIATTAATATKAEE